MAELAEAYVSLSIKLDGNDKARLRDYLIGQAPLFAAGLFRQDPSFEVRVTDGSLKTTVTAIGKLVIVYGGLRAGIDYLVQDAKTFGTHVEQGIHELGLPPERVISVRRRTGLPGEIQNLLHRIDQLEKHHEAAGQDSPVEIRARLEEILAKVDEESDREALRTFASDELRRREQEPPRPAVEAPRVAVRPERTEVLHYGAPGRAPARLRPRDELYVFEAFPPRLRPQTPRPKSELP